jgi:2-oxo-4-hydroxy-4-carboxy-5-ureidoimidazoline decarboxylase
MDGLLRFNRLPAEEARDELLRCCGSPGWAEALTARRPFGRPEEMLRAGEAVWNDLSPDDWRAAFAHHPRIGDEDALRARFASTRQWAEGEQAGALGAPEDVLRALAEGNRAYEDRFGYIFIVCATGKTAPEMLELLQARLLHDPETELRVAAVEQARITRLRLKKLLGS